MPDTIIRGPLKFEVTTSTAQLVAGQPYSMYVKITNPYNVAASVSSIRSRLPVEFKATKGKISEGNHPESTSELNFGKGSLFSEDRVLENVQGSTLGATIGTSDVIVLQPGNSTVKVFTMLATKPLFFTPSTYRLDFLIDYSIDNQVNQDVIETQTAVRAPLWAIINGSLVGALAGRLLHATVVNHSAVFSIFYPSVHWNLVVIALFNVFAMMLLAAVVVVAFARKKDTQPVLSIEDFYGGFFVGTLVGLNGFSAFPQLLPHA